MTSRLRPADRAWLTLTAAILAWEISCPPGEMLSHATARYMSTHRWLTATTITYLALHLADVIPHGVDPLRRLTAITTHHH